MPPYDSGLLHWFARAGYAARGLVYLLVGYLAAAAAWTGSRPEGAQGALQKMWDGAIGNEVLIAVGVGLLLFCAWRLAQSLLDRDGHGADARGLVVRAGLLMSAVTYALLGLFALGFLGGDGGSSSNKAAAFLLSQPMGRAALGAVALIIAAVGFAHLWKAYKRHYLEHFRMSERISRWASPIARFGLALRGITFLIIAGFFVAAALRGRPEDSAGLGKALSAVQDLAYGPVLLGVIALGLVAFGLYGLIEAAWRRVDLGEDRMPAPSLLGR